MIQKNVDKMMSPLRGASGQESKAKTFTHEQVRRIVSEALAAREEKLREEYGQQLQKLMQGVYLFCFALVRILNDRCLCTTEQFEQFLLFNRDYVSRQMSRTECAYVS